jgi:uncharacterized cupin superfamily protein
MGGTTMDQPKYPTAVSATDAPARTGPSIYPEPFASRMGGREKRPLGDLFRLTNFGVNLTRLAPGGLSALRHAHSRQDEFIYVVEGHPTLLTDAGETLLRPGMCAGFKAGTGSDVTYLEMGDRSAGDAVHYPDDDLELVAGADGKQRFARKDGSPY